MIHYEEALYQVYAILITSEALRFIFYSFLFWVVR